MRCVCATCDRPNLAFEVREKRAGVSAFAAVLPFVRKAVAEQASAIVYLPTKAEVDVLPRICCSKQEEWQSVRGTTPTWTTQNAPTRTSASSLTRHASWWPPLGTGWESTNPTCALWCCTACKALESVLSASGPRGARVNCPPLRAIRRRGRLAKTAGDLQRRKGLACVRAHAKLDGCRRRHLVAHFDGTPAWEQCGMCDNCVRREEDGGGEVGELYDAREERNVAIVALRVCRGYYGASTLIDLIVGAKKTKPGREWMTEAFVAQTQDKVSVPRRGAVWWRSFSRV